MLILAVSLKASEISNHVMYFLPRINRKGSFEWKRSFVSLSESSAVTWSSLVRKARVRADEWMMRRWKVCFSLAIGFQYCPLLVLSRRSLPPALGSCVQTLPGTSFFAVEGDQGIPILGR